MLNTNQAIADSWSDDSSDAYEADALRRFSRQADCGPVAARELAEEYERSYWRQPFCNERMLSVASTLRNLADKLHELVS